MFQLGLGSCLLVSRGLRAPRFNSLTRFSSGGDVILQKKFKLEWITSGQKSACAHDMLIIEGASKDSENIYYSTVLWKYILFHSDSLLTYLSSSIHTEVLEGRTMWYSSLYSCPLIDTHRYIQYIFIVWKWISVHVNESIVLSSL